MNTEVLGYIQRVQTLPMRRETSIKLTKKSKEKQYYYITQKLTGAALIGMGTLTIPLSNGDGTAFIMFLIFAIPLIFSRKKLLTIDYKKEGNNGYISIDRPYYQCKKFDIKRKNNTATKLAKEE